MFDDDGEADEDEDDDEPDDEADDDDEAADDFNCDVDGGGGAPGSTNVVDAGKCSRLGL